MINNKKVKEETQTELSYKFSKFMYHITKLNTCKLCEKLTKNYVTKWLHFVSLKKRTQNMRRKLHGAFNITLTNTMLVL